jgi:hypothetical protein
MTELQQALLDYLHGRIEAGGGAPQASDVVRHFRSRREGGIARALDGLAAAGHLAQTNGRWVLKASSVQLHLLPVEDTGPRAR